MRSLREQVSVRGFLMRSPKRCLLRDTVS